MQKEEEYTLKAAFIFNMIKYVEWPSGVMKDTGTISVCMLGHNPFGTAIDVLRNKTVDKWKIEVRNISSPLQARTCNALFISRSEQNSVPAIMAALGELPVLTIGDSDELSQRGIIVNFFMAENRIRFEINMEAVRKSGLKISSHLLKLSRITKE